MPPTLVHHPAHMSSYRPSGCPSPISPNHMAGPMRSRLNARFMPHIGYSVYAISARGACCVANRDKQSCVEVGTPLLKSPQLGKACHQIAGSDMGAMGVLVSWAGVSCLQAAGKSPHQACAMAAIISKGECCCNTFARQRLCRQQHCYCVRRARHAGWKSSCK